MSFEPWQFQYNPPPTVATPAGVITPPAAEVPAVNKPASREGTTAGQLIQQIQDLRDTNKYLQQVILNRCSATTVAVNANDPTIGQALSVIYGKDGPAAITADMYSNLLDAQFTSMQVDMAINGTDLQLNKFEQGAVSTLISAVQDAMVDSGDFETCLPLLLQNLKGDDMVFQNMQTSLATYPAYQTAGQQLSTPGTPAPPITMSNIDVGPETAQVLSGGLAGFPAVYASIYQLATTVAQVTADAQRVLALYVLQPLAMILRMCALYKGMTAMMHKPRLKGLLSGLTNMVYAMLMAQFVGMVMLADKYIQAVLAPLMQMVGLIMQMIAMVNGVVTSVNLSVHALAGTAKAVKATFSSGSLEGMSMAYDCGMPHNAGMSKPPSAFAIQKTINKGVLSMITHIVWGLNWITKQQKKFLEKMNKLLKRKLMNTADMIDLMCSLRELNGLMQLANTAVTMVTGKPNTALNTATGLTAAASTMMVTSSAPAMAIPPVSTSIPTPPTPPPAAVSVINQGGLNPPLPTNSTPLPSTTTG